MSRVSRRDQWGILSPCRLCPRECGADRLGGEKGFCGVAFLPKVAAFSIHVGEEPPLSGRRGAGNIFFSGCNLACAYCQNYPLSQLGVGREMGLEELAGGMLELQRKGAHNINLVTAAHIVPQVAASLRLARARGLGLPVVYNTNGYEKPESVRLLKGLVDIYLPDMKYSSGETARRLSGAEDYVFWNRKAVEAMFRQAGHLRLDRSGIARRGLIVRHLVLPHGLAGTKEVLSHLASRYGGRLHLSLMFQYFPAHRATGDPDIGRRLTPEECAEALRWLKESGLEKGWIQETPREIRAATSDPGPGGRKHSGGCVSGLPGSDARLPSSGRA